MSNYWQRRFEGMKEDAMTDAEDFNDELKERYKEVMEELKKDVEAWYERFARENNVSLADARKQLRAGELKAFKLTLKEFEKLAKQEDLSDDLIKMLDNASIRVRMSWAEELYISMVMRVEQVMKSLRESEDLLKDVYEDSYYRSQYEIQSQTGYTPVKQLPYETIDEVLKNPWANDGKIFSERIWGNQQQLINTLRMELAQSLMLQEGGAPLVVRMMSKFDVSFNQARRLVETETAYVQEKAFMDGMGNLGVDYYEIVATLDSRTTPLCRRFDGKIYARKDAKPGVTMPPFHCYCRTTTVPYLPGISDDEEGNTRAARGEKGKTKFVPASMTYEEWEKGYVKPGESEEVTVNTNEEQGRRARVKINRNLHEVHNIYQGQATFYKVKSAQKYDVWIGDGVKLTQAKLDKIEQDITKALEIIGDVADKSMPRIFLARTDMMKPGTIASYGAIHNRILINVEDFKDKKSVLEQFAGPKEDISTYAHELIHWQQAKAYRQKFNGIKTKEQWNKYIEKLNEDCKKILDSIEKEMYNKGKEFDVEKISKYASDMYVSEGYDEVYTEYLVDDYFRKAGWKW